MSSSIQPILTSKREKEPIHPDQSDP
jgi:hypothetical protein